MEMDTSKIRTEKDLLAYLEAQQQKLDELRQELDERRAESASRRLELTEQKIETLASQGMPYEEAFEMVVAELEESEHKSQGKVERERAERIALELEALPPEQERAILELEDRDDN